MPKDRKQIILQSLARLLEERDATKVTTAVLAMESGITEAALYRHFPSKRSIFLELFSFCDQTIFKKVGEIKKDADIDPEEYLATSEKYMRPNEVHHLLGNSSKAQNELGWKPETKFEDLVKMMVDHDLNLAKQEKTLIDNNLIKPTWESPVV